jgi:hypothetical protein
MQQAARTLNALDVGKGTFVENPQQQQPELLGTPSKLGRLRLCIL